MLNKETKKKIDNCRDILVGVLPLPSDQVELITISLIYKFMDDIDEQSRQLGGTVSFFRNGLKVYSWQNLMSNQLSADERVLKFIKAIEELTKAPHIPELFKSIFRNTFLKFRDGRVFKLFLDEINYFSYDHSEELGNAFEYLLNTMGAQGENGQFRTPRNIIDFIVEVVDPDKDDKILDPACGTAGFLISAYKHILRKYTTGYENYRVSLNNQTLESNGIHWGDKLLAAQRSKLSKRIEGYDNTPLMVRLSQVNMYLHHFPNPAIHDYDSITYNYRWNDKYDCILANPPFMTPKGGVKPHDKFRIRANKTEILFSDYIIEHLTPNGKAGWIVPEGIIFQNSGDYVDLRKWLINEMGLWAVVSLPAQIFQPYSGVKTSILLVDRALARLTENIILVKIENDGFSLNTNRNPIKENDLPAALNLLTEYKKNPKAFHPLLDKERDGVRSTYSLKHKILHRKDFAKLDSYKSTTAAIDFCKKEFKDLQKAEEKYQESLQKESAAKQKQKVEERIKNLRSLFLINTGFNTIPNSETLIKQFVEEQLKDQIILYGEDSDNRVNLSTNLKKAIDWQREYNLSIDKYISDKIVNSDFDLVKIGELITLEYGKALKESDRIFGDYPVFGSNGIVGYHNSYLVEAPFIVVGRKGSAGEITYSEKNGFPIDTTFYVNIIHKEKLLLKYIYYALKKIDLPSLNNQAGVPGINRNDVYDILIPLPPLEIQQKIVVEIEQYQKVIDGCNLVIQNYKPTFKIDESWEVNLLGTICDITTGKLNSNQATKNGQYPFFTCSREVFSIDTYAFDCEAVLLAGNNATGDFNVKYYNGKFNAYQRTYIITIKEEFKNIVSIFIIYYRLLDYLDSLKNESIGSSTRYLKLEMITGIIIPLPSYEDQQKIVEQIHSEMKTIEQCKQLKTQMENKIKEVINSLWKSDNSTSQTEL